MPVSRCHYSSDDYGFFYYDYYFSILFRFHLSVFFLRNEFYLSLFVGNSFLAHYIVTFVTSVPTSRLSVTLPWAAQLVRFNLGQADLNKRFAIQIWEFDKVCCNGSTWMSPRKVSTPYAIPFQYLSQFGKYRYRTNTEFESFGIVGICFPIELRNWCCPNLTKSILAFTLLLWVLTIIWLIIHIMDT